MICVPLHGKAWIRPGEPSAFTAMSRIHRRPNSAAKKCPSKAWGNLVGAGLAALYRYTGPPIGDSDPPPNSGGVPASPP
jgi:hypothetical protein